MKFIRQYWYIIVLLVITLGLGVVTYLTSQRLADRNAVAPTVPQEQPKAVTPACTLTFTIRVAAPTVTPTGTILPTRVPTVTPTGFLAPTSTPTRRPTSTPTMTPVNTPTITPSGTPLPTGTPVNTPVATSTPNPLCNDSCASDTDCPSGLICLLPVGACRNATCVDETDCTCPQPTTPPQIGCNDNCTVTADCPSGLTCYSSQCRNPSCVGETDCLCSVAVAPTTPPSPEVPVSGTPSLLGLIMLVGGIILLVAGLAL